MQRLRVYVAAPFTVAVGYLLPDGSELLQFRLGFAMQTRFVDRAQIEARGVFDEGTV